MGEKTKKQILEEQNTMILEVIEAIAALGDALIKHDTSTSHDREGHRYTRMPKKIILDYSIRGFRDADDAVLKKLGLDPKRHRSLLGLIDPMVEQLNIFKDSNRTPENYATLKQALENVLTNSADIIEEPVNYDEKIQYCLTLVVRSFFRLFDLRWMTEAKLSGPEAKETWGAKKLTGRNQFFEYQKPSHEKQFENAFNKAMTELKKITTELNKPDAEDTLAP